MSFQVETPKNYEQKSVCCFVVDVSSSMSGNPIDELNRGLQEFYTDIKANTTTANRLEIAIVTFNSYVDVKLTPSLVEDFRVPVLTTGGTTALVDGVRKGVEVVELRKSWYKSTGQPYLRPWVVLITDGEPDSDQDIAGLAQEIKDGVNNRKFVFFAIGVQGANMSVLQKISSDSMAPAMLQGLKFGEFFKWMSTSMSIIAGSNENDKVNLPNPNAWMQGFTV